MGKRGIFSINIWTNAGGVCNDDVYNMYVYHGGNWISISKKGENLRNFVHTIVYWLEKIWKHSEPNW